MVAGDGAYGGAALGRGCCRRCHASLGSWRIVSGVARRGGGDGVDGVLEPVQERRGGVADVLRAPAMSTSTDSECPAAG